jgi:hypothetical protein
MPIANYTSTVAPTKSVNEITDMLIKAGARGIATEYDDGRHITALTFALIFDGDPYHYTLPVNVPKVIATLKAQKVDRRYTSFEHAERVAWRILRDWVRAQMAIIQTEMVTTPQVFLPYMRTPTGGTVYDNWEIGRQLPAGASA